MSPEYASPEWRAALELVFSGCRAPNGYTEESLTRWRRVRKEVDAASLREDVEASRLNLAHPNPNPNPNPNPTPNPNPIEASRLNLALLREAGADPGAKPERASPPQEPVPDVSKY